MSSIPHGRPYNDTHKDTTSLAWLSICKQTEKDHNKPSFGCTDRSRSVSGEGADHKKPPPGSGAAKTPEPGRSDQPKYTAESATEILSRFGLDKDDLGELNAYSEDQITPENLKYILMQISNNKKKRAAEKSSESQPIIDLKSDLHKTPIKSNKVIDCGDFGSCVAKNETGKNSTDKSRGKPLVETHKPSEDQLQRCVLKGKSRDLDSKTSHKSEISEQNKMVSPKHKPDEPKLCKPLPPKQPESTSKSTKHSKAEQKNSNSKESKTQIKKTTVAGQNKKSSEKKNSEVQTELKRGQQGQDKSVMETKFKGSSSKNETSHAVISAKQKLNEPKLCKPLPPKQPESTSNPSKAEQKSSNSKESKTQIKKTTVAGQNKKSSEKKNSEVQTELKRGQQGQDKSVMETKFKGSSSKNETSHAVISAKRKLNEPKLCKPLPPKQPESTSKSSNPSKAEQKSSNSKESKTQIKKTTVAGQNKAELKRGQDKSVMQTKFKGSSCKNEPSHATIRDCKGISPESFPHYCSICNKESRDIHACCSHMKTTDHREKCKTLYPVLFSEQQFSRIDSIWRQCQETDKYKSDSHSRNASRSRSQERRHRRDSSSRSPCHRNAFRSRSRSHGHPHRRGSSSRSPCRRNPSPSSSRSHGHPHRRGSSSRSPCRRNPSPSSSRSHGHPHRRGSSSRSPCRRNPSPSSFRSHGRPHRRGSSSRSPCRRNPSPSRFRSHGHPHRRGSSSRSPCRRNPSPSSSRSHGHPHRRGSSSRSPCRRNPSPSSSRSHGHPHRRGSSSRSPCRRNPSPSRFRSHGRPHRRGSSSRSPCRRNPSPSRFRSPGRHHRRGSNSLSPCRRNPSRSRSRSHGRPHRRGSSSLSPCWRNPSRSRSRSPGRHHRRCSNSLSPCRRNPSRSRSRSPGRRHRRGSNSLSPCRRNPSRSRSRSPGRRHRRGSSSPSPCWRNPSRSRSRSPGRRHRRGSSSRSPCQRNPSRSRYRSPGRLYRRGSSSCSHSPFRQRRKSRSRSISTSDSFRSEDRRDRSRSPSRSSYSYRQTLRSRSRSPRYYKSASCLLLDHLLPPGSTSSQGPSLSSSQQRGGPSLRGSTLLESPLLFWDHPFPHGSTSSQGPPLSSFQQRGRPPFLGPPPLSWVSRPSSFSRKKEELPSPGMPSKRHSLLLLSPKSSSKNTPSTSKSGKKQTSGETLVSQDESSAETLVKKLLQSSAVQSLSKQIDVESLVKTLTPVFLDQFNKLTSTAGSSEAPQTKRTGSSPPNHESSGAQKPPVTSAEQKTATEMKSEPWNKIEALNVKEKPKNETELKCPAITPAESKPASIEKPAPVISSDDLTVGEKIEKCFDPKLLWPVKFTNSISAPQLLITNLPNYYDGCYTEDDIVDLLRPFGFKKSSNIYVIPQKQLAIAFMPHVKGLKEALTQSRSGMFFKGSKLCLQACSAVANWKSCKSTSLCLYEALMRCLKHNMTDNGESIIRIHHISPSETRDLRTALRKIGSVRNFLPLLNKVFVEFESKHDADRLGVWYSFLKPGRKHNVERLTLFMAASIALSPKRPAQALPEASDAVATARIPIANGVIKDCAVPPFWVTMSTAPYIFPTMSPWFHIPAFQTVKEISDIKKALPQASQFSTVMLTGFPQSMKRLNLVTHFFSSYFSKGDSQSLKILPLQKRAFVFFPCWDSCHSFVKGYWSHKPSRKNFALKVHLVLEDMDPGVTEETMYKSLMRWSNAHVSEPESLSQRLICVSFSAISLSIIQSFLMAVRSIAPFVNYLVLAECIYIEMCESSGAAQVLDFLLNRLSEEEKKKNDCDQKKKEGFWRKLQNVYLVQRQLSAGGAVSGMAEAPHVDGAPGKIQPAGVQVEAESCEQQQTEAAEEEDVGTDSAEDRTENKSYTQQRQTPADKLSKEEGKREEELIDCARDQEDKQDKLSEEEETPAEKQKTAGKESETRESAAKEDETSSSEDGVVGAGNKEEEEKEASTKPEEVGAETLRSAGGSDQSSPASGDLEEMKETEKEVTSTRKRGRPRKKPRNIPVRKSAGVKHEGSEENGKEEEETKSLPGASLDSSSALLGDVKTETDDETAEVLDQSMNAAAAGDLEEMEEKEQEVASIRTGGRPRKKPRKTPVRKSAGGKPENPEENGEEEDKSLPCASLDSSSSALLGDVKMVSDDEAAEVLDQSVNTAAAGELEETKQTEQEVTSTRKRGRPRKKPRKTPVRKSARGKLENPEENREEEDKSLPGACLDSSSSALLGDVKADSDEKTAEAAGDLEEMEEMEQKVTLTKKRGRSRKKPRKAPVKKSPGGKPENSEENREEETKSLPETDGEGPDRQNLDGRLEEEEDEGRCKADGGGLEEETVPLVLDQSVNAAAAGNLEEMEDTEQEVTSTRKRGRPRKKPRKIPVRKSAGGQPENSEENIEEDKSLPGASLDSSSALLGDVKTETDDEAAEGPDKQNLDGRLEEEKEEDEEACKKQRRSPCTAADFILPPFNPDISFGEEFTARKLGYFCSLCSAFYVLKSNEEDTHCCSRNHYDNLLKHSQMKEEQPSSPPKRKTRSSR
ncbi:uncharacterized protein LOC122820277 isoform X2 [Gambusia affinis]|uniref:uncharacterized protein LOC122820277 isoform X2 n=1 Tax=Gambusia affinis TaxID=33528 RepID=UPI001CDC7199|nr:uncharacterized protein LOC122820277 isoform X2 [Gambusia affinis]